MFFYHLQLLLGCNSVVYLERCAVEHAAILIELNGPGTALAVTILVGISKTTQCGVVYFSFIAVNGTFPAETRFGITVDQFATWRENFVPYVNGWSGGDDTVPDTWFQVLGIVV